MGETGLGEGDHRAEVPPSPRESGHCHQQDPSLARLTSIACWDRICPQAVLFGTKPQSTALTAGEGAQIHLPEDRVSVSVTWNSPPICLFILSFIDPYEPMGVDSILWVIIHCYIIVLHKLSHFGHRELFQVAPASL